MKQILIFRSVRVGFRSLSTQRIVTEYLRCSPNFYRRPRNDVCLVKMNDGQHIFARLQLIFSCMTSPRQWNLALVTLFKTIETPDQSVIGMREIKEDRDTSLIELDWIVRSVYISPTFDRERHYFVNDLVDADCAADVFLRLHSLRSCI